MAFSFIATRASRNLSSRFCLFFVASHFLSLWAAALHWIVQCACAYLPPPRNGAFEHVHTFSKLYNTACNCFPAKPISSSKNAANPNSRAIAANYVRICSATTTKTIQGYLRQSVTVESPWPALFVLLLHPVELAMWKKKKKMIMHKYC